jgi:flagellar motor switch protein FliG
MTAARKAAIVLISIEKPLADQMLARLGRAAAAAIEREIAELVTLTPSEQAPVLEEFLALGERRLRHSIEDLTEMGAEGLRRAYDADQARLWALALAAASHEVREHVIDSLMPDDALALGDAIERLGPFRLDDIEAAQTELLDLLELQNGSCGVGSAQSAFVEGIDVESRRV